MEFRAKTVEEAIEIGLNELGLTKDDADIEIIQKSGLLKKAVVEINKKSFEPATKEDIEESIVVKEEVEEKPQRKLHENDMPVVNFLTELLNNMGLKCELECKSNKDLLHIIIKGDDTNYAIGYRGETLDSLQYMCLLVANKNTRFKKRLIIDAEGYREMRAKALTELSIKLAKKVAKTGTSIELEPMNPFERRVIHTTLQNDAFVETSSEGEEPNRYVVISPIKKETNMYDSESKYNFKKYGTGKTRSFGQKNKRF
ncbi:MAG: protein jag [Clostridia bacterium]|nr:protein jag [Clostridia bacterium]